MTMPEELTKREYFTALALQGLLAAGMPGTPLAVAREAVKYADALIVALEKDVPTSPSPASAGAKAPYFFIK